MEILFTDNTELLELCQEHAQSPEEFLESIEEALETGALSIEEAIQIIQDLTFTV